MSTPSKTPPPTPMRSARSEQKEPGSPDFPPTILGTSPKPASPKRMTAKEVWGRGMGTGTESFKKGTGSRCAR